MNEYRSHFLGKDKMIEALARNGVNIEMKNQLGQTALQYAVDNSNMNFSHSKTCFPISFRFFVLILHRSFENNKNFIFKALKMPLKC